MSNSLDPDKALHFVALDLGPNCLQKLSGNDASKQKLKMSAAYILMQSRLLRSWKQTV